MCYACRHRGHELLTPARPRTGPRSSARTTAGRTGSTAGSPPRPACAASTPSNRPTTRWCALPVAVWAGWVFVNATGGRPGPFADYLGGLAGLIEPYRPASLRAAASHTYEVAANWKVIVENYHECYHCPLIHPELCRVSPPTSGLTTGTCPAPGWAARWTCATHAETMSLDGRSGGRFDRRGAAAEPCRVPRACSRTCWSRPIPTT